MPKVLRIINRFNLGGPTYNVAYLSQGLAPDFETLLIGGVNENEETDSLHITTDLGLHPKLIANMQRQINLRNDLKAYREIRAIIREFQPDIVHTHASKAGLLGRLAAIHEKVPLIIHTFHGHVFHSYFGRAKTLFFKSIERYLGRHSHSIIAISELQKKELSQIHRISSPQKIKVIPLGFDLEKFQDDVEQKRTAFRSKYGLAPYEIAIGIIGRLAPIKNHDFFLKAFAIAQKVSKKKLKAFIVGDGEMRESIEKSAKELGLSSGSSSDTSADVIFTSWIREVDKVLPGLDIVALTSLNEGTPVSLIEAQAAGIPVISTNVGGITDIVVKDKSALLYGSDDINGFAEGLNKLAADDELRKNMGETGRQFAMKNFRRERLVEDMKSHYNSLLNIQ